MTEPKNPKSPSTDEMIAELAEEFGLGGKKDGGEAKAGAASGEPDGGERGNRGKDKDKGKGAKGKERAATPAAASARDERPAVKNPDEGIDEVFFPVTPAKRKALDLGDEALGEPSFREQQLMSSEKRLLIGIGATIAVVVVIAVILLSVFLDRRREDLAKHEIQPDNWWEMLTQFDVHQQDIAAFKARKIAEEKRARTPVYGHIRIETEPPQADVYIACVPMDAHCNNVGTKENPKWDEHFVKDEEIGDKACTTDIECQDCSAAAPAAPAAAPGSAAPAAAPAKPGCRFADARCSSGVCRMPMRTAITIQSLWIGTQAALDKERKYQVRLSRPGWIPETFDVAEADWTNKVIPGREDSDRSLLKQIPLKPDMCCFPQDLELCKKNLPEEICRELEVHLQNVKDGKANCSNPSPEAACKDLEAYLRAKAEYQAAMLKQMEQAAQPQK